MNHKFLIFGIVLSIILLFLINLSVGSVAIPIKEIFSILIGEDSSKQTWEYIVLNYRLPKAIVAMLVGVGLSLSGLLMQTLFRNPLAGPYVLGVSSGASLGVAFVILGSGLLPLFLSDIFMSHYGLILSASLGSFLVLLSVLAVSQRLKDTMAILIVGLMFGSITSAVVSVLTYFSSAEQLKKFTLWSLGNLGNQSWDTILGLLLVTLIGLVLSYLCIKPLNALLLGENYAKSMGINFNRTKNIIIIATSLMAGCITAFVGPIAFVGLAVPHLAKLLFQTSDHKVLFWASISLGAVIMLVCDTISQMPWFDFVLPINAVTSIIGAPVVIWLLVRKRKF
ncbi:MAG: iron ABC transporter permease [Flavobacteriaceae bacterium]